MGFETSNVAAEVGQAQPPNPIATIGSLAQVQNELNQNKMFQAKALAGQYLAGSVGPDGQPDMGKFSAGVRNDPRTAPYAPEILQAAASLQTTGIANAQARTNLAGSRVGNLQGFLGSIPISTNPDPAAARVENSRNLAAGLAQAVQTGLIDQDTATNILGGNPGPDGATFNDQLAMLAKQGAISGKAGASGMQAQGYGTPMATNTGAATVITAPNPITGQNPQIGQPIDNTLSPSEKASAVNVVGPNGVQTRRTLGEFVNPDGSPAAGAPPVVANPEATAAATAVGGSMAGSANYVGSDGAQRSISRASFVNQDGSFKPNVTDADGNPVTDANGVLKVSLSPNDTAELTANATNQADRDTALQTAYEGSPQRLALIKDMLATQGDFRSGPGAAKWAGIVTEANRVLGTKYENTPASAEQVFGKIAEQLSAGQRSTLGLPATNAGTQAAQIASPNTTYSPEANQQVLAQLAGNERLLQAKTAAWNAYKSHPGATYNGFVTQFNQKVDPRAFWEPYMTDQQRAAMMKGMNPNEAQSYAQRKGYTSRLMTSLGVDAN